MNYFNQRQSGFTLVEMAVVLVILAFLITAFLLPLRAQRDLAFQLQTQTTLGNARKALIGFAQRHGRLPCPATNNGTAAFPDDSGTEHPDGSGACNANIGFLPGTTLGIQPTDEQGFALDAWSNRIRYAVTQSSAPASPSTPDFTVVIPDDTTTPAINEADGMDAVGITSLAPDLRVCATATVASCDNNTNLINNAPVVIYSIGATGAQASGGADEDENLDNDGVFVSHTPTAAGAPNGEFDHMVVWLSPYVLYNAMIEAGQLH